MSWARHLSVRWSGTLSQCVFFLWTFVFSFARPRRFGEKKVTRNIEKKAHGLRKQSNLGYCSREKVVIQKNSLKLSHSVSTHVSLLSNSDTKCHNHCKPFCGAHCQEDFHCAKFTCPDLPRCTWRWEEAVQKTENELNIIFVKKENSIGTRIKCVGCLRKETTAITNTLEKSVRMHVWRSTKYCVTVLFMRKRERGR